MPRDSLLANRINVALSLLAELRPHVDEGRAEIDAAIARLVSMLSGHDVIARPVKDLAPPSVTDQVLPPATVADPQPGSADRPQSPYDGFSISEAAVEYLKEVRSPQSAMTIIKALKETGYDIAAANPNTSLAAALTRRAGNYGDVVRVGHGMWALKDFYSNKKELAAAQHKARTSAGMERARARGAAIGQPPKLNADQASAFKKLLKEGASFDHISAVFNISKATIYNYRKKLENWNPGDPYPPQESKEDHRGDTSGSERLWLVEK